MFVVKHIPTGKYIKKTSSHPLHQYTGEFFMDTKWNEKENKWIQEPPLTDNINKARVYNSRSAITNSIGVYKIIEIRPIKTFDGSFIDYSRYSDKLEVDTNIFKIIEVEIGMK